MNKKYCQLSRYKLTLLVYPNGIVSVYIDIRFPHTIMGSNLISYQALSAIIRYSPFCDIEFKPFKLQTYFLEENDGQLSKNLMRKLMKHDYASMSFNTNNSYEIFRIVQNLPLLLYKNFHYGYINIKALKHEPNMLEDIKKQLLLARKENSHT